jgi:ATP-dependent RNA helicase RhlE
MQTSRAAPARGFRAFRLNAALERNLRTAGYHEPRPVQLETIPAALEGRDILGLAQTGTGKTAAFALPILEKLLKGRRARGPRVLVVAPTRELAIQIDAEFRKLAAYTKIRTVVVYGGVSERPQIQKLRRGVDVVVACPGRLLDLHRRGHVPLDHVRTLVLDEADHMFDMGFLPDIRRILAALPEGRQNMLFGATMPSEIRQLAEQILRKPFVAELAHSAPAKTIDHALYPVAEDRKLAMLEHFLRQEGFVSAIVFARTKHRAKRLAHRLDRAGHRAVALQGNMSQSQRDRAMNGFRQGRFDVLVATDIAARGIDVEQVSHVINYDVPNTPEAYTHRIGRTGRSEREGQAFTFVTAGDRTMVHAIERQIGRDIRIGEVAGFGAPFRLTHSAPPRSRPSRAGRQGAARHASRPGTGKPRRSRSGGRRARASAS